MQNYVKASQYFSSFQVQDHREREGIQNEVFRVAASVCDSHINILSYPNFPLYILYIYLYIDMTMT